MNSNYEWQKQQAKERVQAHLNEAAAHRRVKGNGNGRSSFIPAMAAKVKAFWSTSETARRLGGKVTYSVPTNDSKELSKNECKK
jgi:hypothetical protein